MRRIPVEQSGNYAIQGGKDKRARAHRWGERWEAEERVSAPHAATQLLEPSPATPLKPKPKAEFEIPSLDGMRAVAFLIVFIAHAGLGEWFPGGFGVTVFFFLSGYLITTLLRMELAQQGSVSLRAFYLRRVLRILPPFYTVLTFAVLLALAGALPGSLRLRAVLAQYLHFANYWIIARGPEGQAAGTGVYWSLAVEEHFYLLFPLIFVLSQRWFPGRRRSQALLFYALCGVALLWRLALVFDLGASVDRTYMASDTRMDSILVGCALAVGANPVLDRPALSDKTWRYWLLPLGIASLLLSFVIRAPWFRESLRYTIQGLALTPIFVVAIRSPAFGPFKALNWKWVKYIGLLSYSLYLVHHVVLFGLESKWPTLHPVARGGLALLIAIAIAEVIRRSIERPCARLRKRLARATAPIAVVAGRT
jgi:peptidoglycan/LPS O-acetylase OafA/YrhL